VRKVLIYSVLLVAGLLAGQLMPEIGSVRWLISVLAMWVLSYIMIHVGYEFDIDKSRPRQYLWDYVVASTAAAFPWVFCAVYFVYVLAPPEIWGHFDLWRESLLESRFASPTSAGVLFSMLAAAGLSASWVYRKARVLAIFDDLDTILLLIPLKIMMVGIRWQLVVIVGIIGMLLWIAWRYMHRVRLPVTWKYVLVYAAGITVCSEVLFEVSRYFAPSAPIHMEVLLPAFVFGCVLAPPVFSVPADASPRTEETVSSVLSGVFMLLVGMSMPKVFLQALPNIESAATAAYHSLSYAGVSSEVMALKATMPSPGMLAAHVVAVTVISNLGKMFPALCYRKEASVRERLALSVAMFPRGEVGGGVLVASIGYGIGGPALTVAALSLSLNLLCTGAFILVVKKLLGTNAVCVEPRGC